MKSNKYRIWIYRNTRQAAASSSTFLTHFMNSVNTNTEYVWNICSFKVFDHNTTLLLFFNIRAMSFMLQGTHEFLKGTTTGYYLYHIDLTII